VILDDAMLIANNKTGQCSSLPRVCEPKPFGRKRPKTRRRTSPAGSSGQPLVVTTGALPTGYLPTGVLPTGNLPTGPVCTTGCARGRSAAMAVPIKAKDAVPTITNFNIVFPAAQLAPRRFTTNPNDRYEAISRAQTSDSHGRFFDGCCRNGTRFRGLGSRVPSRYCSSPSSLLQKINGKIRPVRAM